LPIIAGLRFEFVPGYGTKVEVGKSPTPPRPLPAPPAFEVQSRTLPALAGRGVVTASWKAADKAVRYRVRVSTDRDGKIPVAVGNVDGGQRSVTVANVLVGRYFVAVASVDSDEFEGRFSAPLEVTLVAMDGVALQATGNEPLLPIGGKAEVVAVPTGTTLAESPTLSCMLRVGKQVRPLTRLPARGRAQLECLDGRGTPLPTVELNVR